jgi:hypothetical protein
MQDGEFADCTYSATDEFRRTSAAQLITLDFYRLHLINVGID